jgi:hypothetical protein
MNEILKWFFAGTETLMLEIPAILDQHRRNILSYQEYLNES